MAKGIYLMLKDNMITQDGVINLSKKQIKGINKIIKMLGKVNAVGIMLMDSEGEDMQPSENDVYIH